MKSDKDVVERALKLLGVVAADEKPTATQTKNGKEALESLIAELRTKGVLPNFSIGGGFPEEAFIPMARFLASEIASDEGLEGPNYARAWLRVRAVFVKDDRREEVTGGQDYA